MKIPQDIRDHIEAVAINRGSQFLTGNPTTLLSTVGSTTAAVGQFGGAVGGLVSGTAKQAADAAAAAATLPIELAQELASYSSAKLGQTMGRVLSFPSMSDVISLSKKYFNERLMSPADIMKELMIGNETLIDLKEETANVSKLKNMQEKISKVMGDVSKGVTKFTAEAQDTFADIVKYAGEGAHFLEVKFSIAENESKRLIDNQLDQVIKYTDKHKEEVVDNLAKSIGYAAADKVNAELRRQMQKKLKKVDQGISRVKISANALAGKALLNLKATLGL